MTNASPGMIDVNQAELEELCNLPFINRPLAEKIIAGRPYQTLQDLRRVNGIGKATVQRLQPFLVVSSQPVENLPPSQDQKSSPPPEAATPLPEPEPAFSNLTIENPPLPAEQPLPEPATGEAQRLPPESSQPEAATPPPVSFPFEQPSQVKEVFPSFGAAPVDRSQILLWGSVVALLILFLSLLFNLGILSVINGGVRYARVNRVADLEQRLSILSKDTENLRQEVSSLRARLDGLEALTGRMDALEQESAALRTQAEQLSGQMDSLNRQLEETRSQLSQLDQRVSVFDRFLERLRSLLNETLPVQP
ncbi:MAG: hypothetical protein HPY59_09840 [Anaerolineae bacterium]|nr:hypothetical protein [Anaerolineae bacterium]